MGGKSDAYKTWQRKKAVRQRLLLPPYILNGISTFAALYSHIDIHLYFRVG